MDNITDKDIETLRLVTEIRETAEKLLKLSVKLQKHSGGNWKVERNSYEGACSEIIDDMERIFIKKFGFIPNEIYPEYNEPVEMLEVGKSYWAWLRHYEGAASEEIEVVAREDKKIYAKLYPPFSNEYLIAVGEVRVAKGELEDGRKVTYEKAYFTWVNDNGYEYYGDIAGWDKVED